MAESRVIKSYRDHNLKGQIGAPVRFLQHPIIQLKHTSQNNDHFTQAIFTLKLSLNSEREGDDIRTNEDCLQRTLTAQFQETESEQLTRITEVNNVKTRK